MSAPPPDPNLTQAHEALGAYFCAYSKVDHEVGEIVKVVLGLRANEAGDAIVAALGDFKKKASLVLAASLTAKQADGKDASDEWKASVKRQINRAFECNDKRVPLAHSLLEPQADGSVRQARQILDRGTLKQSGKIWIREELLSQIQTMEALAAELHQLTDELSKFKYTVPLEAGWLASRIGTIPAAVWTTDLEALIRREMAAHAAEAAEGTGRAGLRAD
jgi:hypothetical protein